MFCPKCGKELPDMPKYCRYCGLRIEPEGAKKGGISNRKALILGISILAALAVIVGIYRWNHSAYRIYWNLLNGNEQKANSLFERYYDDLTDHDGRLEKMILSGIDINWQDFSEEKISAEEAHDYLDKLEALGAPELKEIIIEKRNAIEKLEESREEYAEGMESLENGDYEAAILSFQAVIEEDSHYDDAKQQELLAKSNLKDQMSLEVEQKRKNHAYEEALHEIADLESILPDDNDLIELKTVCEREAFLYEIACAFQIEDLETVLELIQSDAMADIVNKMETASEILWISEADSRNAAKGLEVYPLKGEMALMALYYGEYVNGMRQGEGTWLLLAEVEEKYQYHLYQGQWVDDYPNGEGVLSLPVGQGTTAADLVITGTFVNGWINGQMTVEWVAEEIGEKFHGKFAANNGIREPVEDEKTLSLFPALSDGCYYYAFSDEKSLDGIPKNGLFCSADAPIGVLGAYK